ncbi:MULTISPECIES: DUF2892 domain-containing protein [unclassified Yoonia]|uniref:YgaP family membrane protein n=1 Tax=unclassified Yoonia TaxID=2629118 RepID=UPI002AFDD6AE|nr:MULTISPECIES: DUF2892 domain-containing protein [unclassified Yoonia]
MPVNVGDIDRVFRVVLGIVLLALPFVSGLTLFNSPFAIVISVALGLVMLVVAATRSCPLYTLLGVRTCKM